MNRISLNRVNHVVLSKQHLTDDAKIDDVIQIVKDIGGLHATNPTTPYLSLFSRTQNFTREQLDQAIYIKRNLGKIRCMRKTVYILPKDMITVAFAATRKMVESLSEHYIRYLGVSKKEYEEISERIIGIIKGRGMTTKEIARELGTTSNVSPVVNFMCDQGLLIRGIPQKGWRSNIHTYYPFQEYFPNVDLSGVDEAKARQLLVSQYLASFGPATESDIVWWTGFPKGEIRRILKSLQRQTTCVRISDTGSDFILLRSDEAALHSLKLQKRHFVNFLPTLDPYLMGYKERERYLNHKDYDKIFDRSGNATSTILLDGRVIGVWDFAEDPEPTIKIFFFGKVGRDLLRGVHLKAHRIGQFICGEEVQIKECASMVPLTRRTAGGVMSPLRGC